VSDKFEENSLPGKGQGVDGREPPVVPKSRVNRRQALARLGLGVSVAYAAPALMTLSLAANHGGDEELGDAKPTSGASGPGKASGPSAPSAPGEAIEEPCGGDGQPACQ
jgi:hypothetical protein